MLNLRPVVVGYVPGAYIRPVDDKQNTSAPVKMRTIAQSAGVIVRFNGSRTYFVSDSAGQCRLATNNKRRAINMMNAIANAEKA